MQKIQKEQVSLHVEFQPTVYSTAMERRIKPTEKVDSFILKSLL
jgi:hypothetical protein